MAFEGESERAFVAWLQDLCDENGLNVHLDRPAWCKGGGDPLALVEDALKLRHRSKERAGVGHRSSCVLIDTDRLDDGTSRSCEAIELATREQLILIRQRPCFEAVLLRLHAGHENTSSASSGEAKHRLERVWNTYRKPPTKAQLAARFQLADLMRTAEKDKELHALLKVIGFR